MYSTAFLATLFIASAQAPAPLSFTHAAMGTEFEFTVYAAPGEDARLRAAESVEAAFALVDDIESRISSWRDDSQTAYVNRHAGVRPVRVSHDLLELVETAKRVHALTGGAFDVTVGPLIECWSLRTDTPAQPEATAIERALALVDAAAIEIDAPGRTVFLPKSGMQLDFGAIGKGFALDRAAALLRARGIEAARLSAGTSSVVAIGAPPGEPGWKVHIRHPYNPNEHIDTLVLRDEALSTSACYPETGASRGAPCDVLDPRTGYPARAALSATVAGASATECDAVSTAFLVMGADAVRAFGTKHAGLRAVIVSESADGTPHVERMNDRNDAGELK